SDPCANVRLASASEISRTFAQGSLGFARLDFDRKPKPRLVATLLDVPAPPLRAQPRAVARFEITPDGAVNVLDAAHVGP
ncbi:MAG TPA: hypothetical protein VNE71_06710, partial [Myxococcota bacterium]|nr:hypothetical protein [Myxococcota bacterium]